MKEEKEWLAGCEEHQGSSVSVNTQGMETPRLQSDQ